MSLVGLVIFVLQLVMIGLLGWSVAEAWAHQRSHDSHERAHERVFQDVHAAIDDAIRRAGSGAR